MAREALDVQGIQSTQSGRIFATYWIEGDRQEARARGEALALEQSHEFPRQYAPVKADRSLGRVESVGDVHDGGADVIISYPQELTAFEIPQLLVVLLGNGSLLPGIRLVDFSLTPDVVKALGNGPALGIAGIRKKLGVPHRALLATALKPVGLDVEDIAELGYESALGGIDLIKDDQGLGNQPWAPFEQRVPAVAAAIERGSEKSGHRSFYLPVFNPPAGQWNKHLDIALENGVGGMLVCPGTAGFDALRYVRDNTPDDFIVYAHPAFLGGWTSSDKHGIAPEILFGHLLRLAGADSVIYPSFGGRFSFTPQQCKDIADFARDDFEGMNPALPSPGGGMTVERVPELLDFFGPDTLFLIGGALHATGNLVEGAQKFRRAVEK